MGLSWRTISFVALVLLGFVFADQEVFASSDITVSISSSEAHIQLVPESLGSVNQSITVSTTSTAGYTLKLSSSSSSTDLVNLTDSTKTIPTFTMPGGSSSLPASSVGNGYGYSVDGGVNYSSVPSLSSNHAMIAETYTSGENTHTLTFGAKVSASTAAGTYSNTFLIYAVAKLEPCSAGSICYYGNNDDGTGFMSDQSASSNSSATLIPSNYSRSGYGFAGWNTEIDGSGTNYGPNQTISTGDLTNVGLQLYANWIPSAGELQNWNGCSSLEQGKVTALTDARDGNTYAVAKYADGQCWMMENLRLDLSASNLVISSQNTNRPTTEFANTVNSHQHSSSNSFCTDTSASCLNQVLYNTNNTNRSSTLTPSYSANDNHSSWYSYGNYYNWYTLTAGNGTASMSTKGTATNGDLCPTNWRLPAGYGDVGDLAKLDKATGGTGKDPQKNTTSVATSERWRAYPMNFIYSGEQKGNSGYNRSISGSFGTLTAYGASATSNLWLKTDNVYMNSNSTQKNRGQTARCLFSGGYHVEGNIHYDANGGTGTMTDETDVDFGTALAANNQFIKQYSVFVSWNTASDGSGVVVTEGGTVDSAAEHLNLTDGDTLTLYAIWQSQYSLAYDGNGADTGSMVSAGVQNVPTGSLRLVASNYSRAGYGFAGWSLDSDAASKLSSGNPVTIYGPNETITVNNSFYAHADPANNQISLYAVWLPEDTTYTMQTFGTSQCNALNTGDILALKDVRDNNVYSVAKLGDGHCWMVENLRLIPSASNINSTNTNSPTADFLTAASTSSSLDTLCNTDNRACVDHVYFNANNIDRSGNLPASYSANAAGYSWYSYGVMYNWYTASAGNGNLEMGSGNVAGDFCPTGWRLPTGGNNGEFATLNTAINGGVTATDSGFRSFPANFIYSGDYNYNTPGGRNTFGRFWSATPDSASTTTDGEDTITIKAHRLGIAAQQGVTPIGSWNKWDAFAIRCIVK